MSKCQTNSKSFRNVQNIGTIDTLSDKVKNNDSICAICLIFMSLCQFSKWNN